MGLAGSREPGLGPNPTLKSALGRHTSFPGNRAGLSEATEGVNTGRPQTDGAEKRLCYLGNSSTGVKLFKTSQKPHSSSIHVHAGSTLTPKIDH